MTKPTGQISWFEWGECLVNGYVKGWLWYYVEKRFWRDYGNEYIAVYYNRNTNTDTIIKSRCGLDEAKAACEQHNQMEAKP